mmetsp:Transcript_24293/g.43216  ORF Transcript_24293/g.43216 Transcript_24293/m.43216 type:complete len:94 (+) Transcript_24293:36-317(+)
MQRLPFDLDRDGEQHPTDERRFFLTIVPLVTGVGSLVVRIIPWDPWRFDPTLSSVERAEKLGCFMVMIDEGQSYVRSNVIFNLRASSVKVFVK